MRRSTLGRIAGQQLAVELFRTPLRFDSVEPTVTRYYDATADGQQFLMIVDGSGVLNSTRSWLSDIVSD